MIEHARQKTALKSLFKAVFVRIQFAYDPQFTSCLYDPLYLYGGALSK